MGIRLEYNWNTIVDTMGIRLEKAEWIPVYVSLRRGKMKTRLRFTPTRQDEE
ncbi:MAG: hypothetical protein R6U84_04925 [Candidatus Cloacimonadales bacterium]